MTEKKEAKTEEKSTKETKSSAKIAIIRVRGQTGIRGGISDTLKMLNLNTKFSCTVVPKNPSSVGMIKKAKDFITWGEITSDVLKTLDSKRKEEGKKTYRLHPPRGGFERKGTKKSFVEGGVLGNRKDKINELIKKMI